MNKNSTLFSALLRLVPLKWQRILEHSRMRKSDRGLRRFRKKVFLLGKHGTLLFHKSMPFIFVATVFSLFYLLCLKLGAIDFFHYLISKMGFSLGSRVLLSRGLGCEGWLLLVFLLAAFEIFDGTILNMTGGNETVNQGPHRGDAASQPSTARAPEPSTSSTWSGSWIRDWLYPEVSSSAPNQGGQPQEEGCLFQPTQPSPADSRQEPTPPHSTEPEAAPPSQSVSPYPYAFDLIGGESVEGIKRRLLLRHEGYFTFEVCELARIQAEDLFEAKVEILREMSRLDPEGPWLERGARALDNPRTSTGEESLERLFSILDQLKEGGRESDAFIRLKKKL